MADPSVDGYQLSVVPSLLKHRQYQLQDIWHLLVHVGLLVESGDLIYQIDEAVYRETVILPSELVETGNKFDLLISNCKALTQQHHQRSHSPHGCYR